MPRFGSTVCALAVAGLVLISLDCQATVVERVVAVVGERAILLSDLRRRAAPYLLNLEQSVPPGAARSAQISQLYKKLLEQMVDEELEERAAMSAKVVVTEHEIDAGLEQVAARNGVSVNTVLSQAVQSGLAISDFRSEIRRQVLQTKLIALRIQGRIRRPTEDDMKDYYRRLVLQEREKLPFTAAWVLITTNGDPARRRLAEQVAEEAKSADFAELARRYSDDDATRSQGGVLGIKQLSELPPALSRVVAPLEVGQVSGIVSLPNGFAVIKVLRRDASQLPPYAEAREGLAEGVYSEKMSQALRGWLDALRRQQHVEIRL